MDDLLGLAVGAAGRKRNVEEQLLEGALLLVGPAGEGGRLAQLPLHVAAVVAIQLVADGADVFRHVEHDRLVLEILDLELDDDFAVVQVAGDPPLLVLVDGPLDNHVLGDTDIEPHFIVQRGELAPVLADEGRAAVTVFLEDPDFAVLQRSRPGGWPCRS